MNTISFHLDIVTTENCIFSGRVQMLGVSGTEGELGIYAGHTPLLTAIEPGVLKLRHLEGEEQFLYISGGMLEVQPDVVTVMADTVIRGEDLDEQYALKAKEDAQKEVARHMTDTDFAHAAAELSKVLAQLRVIKLTRKSPSR